MWDKAIIYIPNVGEIGELVTIRIKNKWNTNLCFVN